MKKLVGVTLLLLAVAGPAAAGLGRWTSQGPDQSDVISLAIDPLTPSTLYAGTLARGVFKTTDGGASWQAAMASLPPRRIAELLVDRATPSTVFAGTDQGVYKSTDGGASWATVNDGLTELFITGLVADGGAPARLYASTESAGVFVSADRGESWSAADAGLTNLRVTALAGDPQAAGTAYAGTEGGMFKTTDGGASWSFLLDFPAAALAVDPSTPSVVYAGAEPVFSGVTGLLRSMDGGASWSSSSLPAEGGVGIIAFDPSASSVLYLGAAGKLWKSADGAQSWTATGLSEYFSALAIDAQSPSTLYVGGIRSGVWKSVDGGVTWSGSSHGLGRAAVKALAIDPAASVLYAGTGGRVYRSSDRGQTWAPTSTELPLGINALAVDPSAPETVYAAIGLFGDVLKSTDGGATWEAAREGITDRQPVRDLAVDPAKPSTLYAATTLGVFKTTDGGASWQRAGAGRGVPLALTVTVDPRTAAVYAGTGRGLFRSTDEGETWTRLDLPLRLPYLARVAALDPQTPSTLYAVTRLDFASRLWKSTDGGASWSRTGLDDVTDANGIAGLVIDPAAPENLYVGMSKEVLRSTDGGATWSPFSQGLSFEGRLRALAIAGPNPSSADASSTVFAATDDGVFDVEVVAQRTVLELQGGRFEVEVEWRDFGNATGPGTVAVASGDSGLFYFFSESNWELLVKVLDGCELNGHFWVFGAATTNVEYTLRVTDTVTRIVKTYHNPLGVASPAITDTQAFATCGARGFNR